MTKRRMQGLAAALVVAGLAAGCGYDNGDYGSGPGSQVSSQVVKGDGDITPAVNQFRGLLGGNANTVAGDQGTGRREINWDGVGAALLNVNTFPGDQFNRVVPRGQVFTTPGTGFRVSDNAMADLEPTDATQFAAFSPVKTFISVGSPVMDVTFRVAGSDDLATVTGFGVVFSDVDRANSTSLEFFDASGKSLRKVKAPVRTDAAGFSFAGAVFEQAVVARVRITAGNAAVAAGVKDLTVGGTADLVVTDDFISGEPHKIP